ncbi:hypothetical protein [Geoglobus acetivorans]|uniref:Uncharacterized protein n=1 Tax=Geoglobus acetivorans TaxID=565033 RepID=A0ABZ3H3Q5_GEOAI|nr:hypothetical protein [Geoglobus acetivorans]
MLADFLLPWAFGSQYSPLFYSLITNGLALMAYPYISKTRLAGKVRVLAILFVLWLLNLAGLGLAILMFRIESILLWKITGDYRVMSDMVKVTVLGIPGKTVSNLLFSAASIPGSALMGYASCYAYLHADKKKVIVYWILINFLVTYVAVSVGFCGYSPWKC